MWISIRSMPIRILTETKIETETETETGTNQFLILIRDTPETKKAAADPFSCCLFAYSMDVEKNKKAATKDCFFVYRQSPGPFI
jgi:hypothetical protein